MSDMALVMRTGQLYRLDMADEALKNAQIPHFLREEDISGIRYAMPAAPSMDVGVCWSILVPCEFADEAKHVLSELPFEITTNPDVFDNLPDDPKVRRFWRVLYSGVAVVVFGGFLYHVVTTILRAIPR